MAGQVVEALGPLCVGLLADAVSQVPIELAEAGRAHARSLQADCLISFGGGAAVGLGKGIALETAMPIIAVPTTYSGSEMTGFCGITIAGVKRMHQSLNMLARTVIYDPELTLRLPAAVSAASALNALAHCVEAVYVPTANPILALAGVEGAKAINAALPLVAARPDDLEARSALLYGAYMGGAALTAGFALQHGIAHVLAGSFGVEHGLSHAIVLPHVTAYNGRFAPEAVGRIAEAIGAADAAAGLFDLLVAAGLPTSLTAVGIEAGQLDEITRITIETDHGNNPGPVDAAGIRSILEAAFAGRRPGRRLSPAERIKKPIQPMDATREGRKSAMIITRRRLAAAAGAVAAASALPRRANAAAEFALRFGHGYPSTHPLNVRAIEAAARIKDETKGRVTIDLFPDSQLGGDSDLLSQLRSGALDMFSTGGLILSTLVRVASINGMGFAFADYDKVWPAMDGDLGAFIRDGFTKAGLHAFGRVWDNGFRQISSSTRPITSPQD